MKDEIFDKIEKMEKEDLVIFLKHVTEEMLDHPKLGNDIIVAFMKGYLGIKIEDFDNKKEGE